MSGKSQNAALKKWVAEWADILEPDDVYWCDGSEQEYNDLCEDLVLAGTFTKLNDAKRQIPTGHIPIRATWLVLKTAPTFVPPTKLMQARTTTGASQAKCAPTCWRCTRAQCAAA